MMTFNKVWITNLFRRDENFFCNTIDAYKKHLKDDPYMVENISKPSQQIKPVFDVDSYDNDINIDDIILKINDMFPNKKICYAKREPRIKDGKLRYSGRIYVVDVRIKIKNLQKLIIDKGYTQNEPFDLNIYNRGNSSVLHLPLTTKKRDGDVPPLIPVDCDIFDCCASYIEESYEDWDLKFVDNQDKKEDKKEDKIDIFDNDIKDDEDNEDLDKYKKLQKLISKTKDERADNYDTWISMVWCINNIGIKENIKRDKIIRLIHLFSKKSKTNYCEDKVDEWIDKNLDKSRDKGYGWKYLYETCIKNDDPIYYNKLTKSYYNVKKEFEINNFKILFPPCIITNYKGQHKVQPIKAFKQSYQHLRCVVKTVKKDKENYEEKAFIDLWLNDPQIRNYNIMVHKPPPLKVENDEFNLWTNFKILDVPYIQDNKDYIINEFLSYMNNLLNNKNVVDFMLAYFAQRLQKPAFRCKVLISLFGEEGDGKNRLLDIFKNIFGEKFIEIESADLLYEKHSIIERDKLFVCVNEATSVGFTNSERLKSRITTDTLLINEKGINPYNIDNYCDYLYTTNNPNALDVKDTSRRFLAIQVSSYYNRNVEFFNKFSRDIVDNPDSLRVIYEYLMNFDVSSIITTGNFQNHIPNTEFQQQLIIDNKDKIELFLRDLVRQWSDTSIDFKRYKNKELFAEWRKWLTELNIKNDYNAIAFGTRLGLLIKKKNIQDYIKKDTHSNTLINFIELKTYFDENP